ncbi:MAG TPA: hypothetical protein VF210_18180 [Pseudomonadales bacterium]
MTEVVRAAFRHALFLADRLRYEDVREIAAVWGVAARPGLFYCLMSSDRTFAVLEDGEPVALWGISSRIEGDLRIGLPWLLAAPRLFEGPRSTLLRSRRVMDHLLAEHDVLTNVTDADNHAHLRWLWWCGFAELCRHERYGAGARPFVEFYRVNPRSGLSDAAVRAVLRRCRPAGAAPDDPVVRGLVELGVELLARPTAFERRHARALAEVLDRLAQPGGTAGRTRRGCVRLLVELAVALTGIGDRAGVPPSAPLAELITALAAAADLGALAGVAVDDALLALGGSGRPAPVPAPKLEASAPRMANEPVGSGLAALLRRHLRLLTLDGRVGRAAGHRFWSAALGADEDRLARSVGVGRPALGALLAEHRLQRELLGDAQAADGALAAALSEKLEHGAAVAALRGSVPVGHPLGAPLTAELDALPLNDEPVRIGTVGDLVYVASAVADRAARRVLPSLRLGGAVAGYGDRHWLYRLLRVRLIQAAPMSAAALGALLAEELGALLAAGAVEDALLAAEGPLADLELHRIRIAALAVRAGEHLDDSALARWLAAPLAVPVRHHLELGPALFAWYSHGRGEVADHLDALADVLGAGPLVPRQRYRSVLRRFANGLDIVTLANHLGLDPDAQPDTFEAASRLGGR